MNFSALETTGGKMALAVALLVWLGTMALVMHIMGKDPGETGRTLLSNAFTSLFTIVATHLSDRKGN